MEPVTVEITFPEGTPKEKRKTLIEKIQALINDFNRSMVLSYLALLSVSIILL